MTNNCPCHPAIISGVESIFLRLSEILFEKRLGARNGGQFSRTLRLGLCQLFRRHPSLIRPRTVANGSHDRISGLAIRAVRAGCKLVKSPVGNTATILEVGQ